MATGYSSIRGQPAEPLAPKVRGGRFNATAIFRLFALVLLIA
jgi:hypothetical protein